MPQHSSEAVEHLLFEAQIIVQVIRQPDFIVIELICLENWALLLIHELLKYTNKQPHLKWPHELLQSSIICFS